LFQGVHGRDDGRLDLVNNEGTKKQSRWEARMGYARRYVSFPEMPARVVTSVAPGIDDDEDKDHETDGEQEDEVRFALPDFFEVSDEPGPIHGKTYACFGFFR